MGRLDPWAARLCCDHALLYVTGGAAFLEQDLYPSLPASQSVAIYASGWTVRRFDYAFTNNWFTDRIRYSQYEGDLYISDTYPESGIVGFKQELNGNQVTARIGYKF
jgi:hypothetical protein